MGTYAHEEQTKEVRISALDELDRELERFDTSLERLDSLVSPVLSHYEMMTDKAPGPHPEPMSPFHARIERMQDQLRRLDVTMNRIIL